MPAAADTCLCLTRACAAGSFVPRRLAGDHRRERSNRACPGWASPGTACAAGAPAHLSACSSAPQACSRAGSRAVFRLRLPCRDAAAEPDGSAPQARARSPAGYAVLRRRLAIPTVRAAARVPAPQAPQAPPRRLAACCHCVSPRTRATHWAQARRRRSAGAVPGNTGRWAGGHTPARRAAPAHRVPQRLPRLNLRSANSRQRCMQTANKSVILNGLFKLFQTSLVAGACEGSEK